jgi:hypothetical protein
MYQICIISRAHQGAACSCLRESGAACRRLPAGTAEPASSRWVGSKLTNILCVGLAAGTCVLHTLSVPVLCCQPPSVMQTYLGSCTRVELARRLHQLKWAHLDDTQRPRGLVHAHEAPSGAQVRGDRDKQGWLQKRRNKYAMCVRPCNVMRHYQGCQLRRYQLTSGCDVRTHQRALGAGHQLADEQKSTQVLHSCLRQDRLR